jgi:hypothetical protein
VHARDTSEVCLDFARTGPSHLLPKLKSNI